MKVRAKFIVTSVTMYQRNYGQAALTAIHDTSTPENERFTHATPSGKLEMTIDNPSALAEFTPGKQFYVDFTPVEE